jgi:predicted dehydrogenase
VTRTPEKVADFADRHGLPVTDDYASVLDDPEIQAVVLATPHSQHLGQIEAAAAAGKHVFVEKPLTLDASSAKEAVAACESADVVLALGHNRRFLPALKELQDMIVAGELGSVMHVEGNFSGNGAYGFRPGMWRADPTENPAGGMAAMGIHMVDALIHLCGPIASVQAQSLRQVLEIPVDDTTSMLFRFENGITGYLGTITATPRLWRMQVFGSKGWAHMRDPQTIDVRRQEGEVETLTFPALDIEFAELEAFAQAVSGGAPYPVTPEQAVHGIAVFEAVARSVDREGARVDLM